MTSTPDDQPANTFAAAFAPIARQQDDFASAFGGTVRAQINEPTRMLVEGIKAAREQSLASVLPPSMLDKLTLMPRVPSFADHLPVVDGYEDVDEAARHLVDLPPADTTPADTLATLERLVEAVERLIEISSETAHYASHTADATAVQLEMTNHYGTQASTDLAAAVEQFVASGEKSGRETRIGLALEALGIAIGTLASG